VSAYVYVIEGRPVSGKNSQRIAVNRETGNRFTLKSKAATAWNATATRQLIEQRGRRRKLAGALYVEYTAYQTADICDLDNITSALFDALKGIVIEDDSMIVEYRARKAIDRVRPRIEVSVRLTEAA
jgi:Holliday junction resolvase RusA-like endonuclease